MLKEYASCIVSLVFIIGLVVCVPAQEQKYFDYIDQLIEANPENQGLRSYRRIAPEVIGSTSQKEPLRIEKSFAEMDSILENGWTNETETIGHLQKQYNILLKALELGNAGPIEWPGGSTLGMDTPVPNFLNYQKVTQLLCCGALYHQSQGDMSKAVSWAGSTSKFAALLLDDNLPVIHNLMSISNLDQSFETTLMILQDRRLQQAQAQSLGSTVYAIEKRLHDWDLKNVLINDSLGLIQDIQQKMESGMSVEAIIQAETGSIVAPSGYVKQYSRSIRIIGGELTHGATLQNYRNDMQQALEILEKPFAERQGVDYRERLQSRGLKESSPNATEMENRFKIMRAKLRLCLVLASIKSGKPEVADQFIDPFTGEKMKKNSGVVFSVGPDMTSQQGRQEYEKENGTVSQGDIFARY